MTALTSGDVLASRAGAVARGLRTHLLAALCAVGGACAGGARPAAVPPADIPALERQAAQTPNDPALNLRLARAYYAANRFADGRRALALVLAAQPENPEAQAYLGLTYEGLEQFDSARSVYTRLLATRQSRTVQRLLSGRLVLLTRHELQYAARQAIARESLLARTPPAPNTVAVMPFRYTGGDSTLRPLERGLAALVVTDFSRVRRLKLVEREQLQALLDELKLAESGKVDPATAARSGRLMGAAQVVQGSFTEVPTTNFRVDATMVNTTDAQVAAAASGADQLLALFDIEKAVVFELIERLGITLTPAERTAISERPTRDIQAFLLYSRGLEAQDRGDFAAASQAFQAAARRDPGFSAAAQAATTSQAAQAAVEAPPTEVASAVAAAPEGGEAPPSPGAGTLTSAIDATVPSGTSTLNLMDAPGGNVPPPTNPNPSGEGGGINVPGPTLIGTIIIIIRRP
ncbi:MAG: hypothetical protein HYS40_02270 [Gemmatimonadetes bacterium]|nr:hypothetical protein [Gemmatimonadota bacterium]